ncbi:hypothetical protein EW146_g5597 [Bondarzewia mesenterica]|uniref:RTA1-domain-containing protein n=1 Tax=Bondarzewia mesenterica TaxID=1095465 RepID=A0A4S4LWR0_9AGAM|nr:hypothetical protein EW146_g5597 [Bondarzewia mesenterica]
MHESTDLTDSGTGTRMDSADLLVARTHTLYGYVPTEWVCALFVALFGLSTLLHVIEAAWSRLWWLFVTAVVAGILEILGWSGRLWSSRNPSAVNPFLMQIITTIIAPTPLVAANFVILGRIVTHLGQQYSRLSAYWYTIIFCICDLIALVVQAVGGALAAEAVQTKGGNPKNGGHIMLGGIVFQLAAIVAYSLLAAEFFMRYAHDAPVHPHTRYFRRPMDKNMKLMIGGLSFMTLTIFIRSIYRTIELSDGWTGRIIRTQVYFNVLDGAMITLAIFTLNIFHPGWLLAPSSSPLSASSSQTDAHPDAEMSAVKGVE